MPDVEPEPMDEDPDIVGKKRGLLEAAGSSLTVLAGAPHEEKFHISSIPKGKFHMSFLPVIVTHCISVVSFAAAEFEKHVPRVYPSPLAAKLCDYTGYQVVCFVARASLNSRSSFCCVADSARRFPRRRSRSRRQAVGETQCTPCQHPSVLGTLVHSWRIDPSQAGHGPTFTSSPRFAVTSHAGMPPPEPSIKSNPNNAKQLATEKLREVGYDLNSCVT